MKTPACRTHRHQRLTYFKMRSLALAAGCACLWSHTASATDNDEVNPADLPQADLAIQAKPTDQWTGLWSRQNLLGDMGGLRSELGHHGVTVGLTETSEELANVHGAAKTGSAYDGLTTLTLGLDTRQAFGIEGGNFNLSVLNVHGHNLSQSNLETIQTASGIEADSGTRLWEMWYQQKFLDGAMDIKLGQQSIDQEFMVSQYAGTFMNTMFGWPTVPSYDMPSGGPAYPLSALGVRLRARPTDSITLLTGVYDGNPTGNNNQDQHGTLLNTHNGALIISELQYGVNQPVVGQLDSPGHASGLPGMYKIGAWYNTQNFADQHYDDNGVSLADPNSDQNPRQHPGNYSLYAVADQMVWRQTEDSSRAVGVFARAMIAPPNRNEISMSANLGATLTAPFDGRDNDTAGLGFGYARVSNAISALDADSASFNQVNSPVRHAETFAEVTYQYQLTPWWQLQADIQYVWNPGAGVASASNATQRLNNALVIGLRTNITL